MRVLPQDMSFALLVTKLALSVRSYGYDPLSLGKDAETVEKYRAYELLHARWAMLAAAGIIIPEGLQVCFLMQCAPLLFAQDDSICTRSPPHLYAVATASARKCVHTVRVQRDFVFSSGQEPRTVCSPILSAT